MAFAAYYMVAMATFGAFAGALNGNSHRISEERKVGWIRQLRLTAAACQRLRGRQDPASMATTIPSVVIVLLLGRFYGGVHLAAWQWLADRGHHLARVDDLRRARGRDRLPVPAGQVQPMHVAAVLHVHHPRRALVPADRLPGQDRPCPADLSDHPDRHGPDQQPPRCPPRRTSRSSPGSRALSCSRCWLSAERPRRSESAVIRDRYDRRDGGHRAPPSRRTRRRSGQPVGPARRHGKEQRVGPGRRGMTA